MMRMKTKTKNRIEIYNMNIGDKEEKLFDKWSSNREGFVADGVVDEEMYLNSSPKIMFILKEANDLGGGGWDLRQFIKGGDTSNVGQCN